MLKNKFGEISNRFKFLGRLYIVYGVMTLSDQINNGLGFSDRIHDGVITFLDG